jgi:CheY-like chemotaxis protein
MTRAEKPVLVVEDHDDARQMMEWFLTHVGYRVCSAEHGVAALQCISREAPCVILLDVSMPVMDGLTFARLLRALPDEQVAGTPIILLSGTPKLSELVTVTGAVDAFAKPAPLERVAEAVARYCVPRPSLE